MIPVKALSIRALSIILCISFLVSCSSNSNVVSSKRKYRNGWFLNKRGSVDTKANTGKDSTLGHVYSPGANKQQQTGDMVQATNKEKAQGPDKRELRRIRRDSARAVAQAKKADKRQKGKEAQNKPKGPPAPPDDFDQRLIIMIVVLASLAILTTGLITPIAIWGITQNFLIIVGVIATYLAFFTSIDGKLGIDLQHKTSDNKYNLGNPSLALSLWATGLIGLLYAVVKTSALANVLAVEVTTLGMFVAGACVLLSMVIGTYALCVEEKHKPKAVFALIIDVALIIATVMLF